MEDDCFAVRLAYAYRRRFGRAALDRATLRLARAVAQGSIVKTDLFIAVTIVLRDDRGVFGRSRGVCPEGLPLAA